MGAHRNKDSSGNTTTRGLQKHSLRLDIVLIFLMSENEAYGADFFADHCAGAPHELDFPKHNSFSLDCIDRNFACRDRKMDSSDALESYGSLFSNAPSLAAIV